MLAGGSLTCMVVPILLISDKVVAGVFLGENAVSGINLIMPLYDMASFFSMLFSLGIPILYSNAMGAFDKEEANRVFGVGLFSSIFVGLIMFITTFLFMDQYLLFFRTNTEITLHARVYCSWIHLVILLLPIQNLLGAMVFTDGDEKLILVGNIAEVFGNLTLSILLAGRLGTAGIAIGSLGGVVLSIIIYLFHFFSGKNSLKPNLYFSGKLLFSAARYGLTDSVVWLFMSIYLFVLNRVVADALGQDKLVLVSVVNLMMEMSLIFDGVGEALTPIVSIYYSEQCYAGIKKIWKYARRTAFAEGIILLVLCFAFAGNIPYFLGIHNDLMSEYAETGIRILSVSFPAVSMIFLLTSYYLIVERITLSFMIIALRSAVIALPLSIIGIKAVGTFGMFWGVTVAPYIVWFVLYLYIRMRYGRDDYPLILSGMEKDVMSFLLEFPIIPEEIVKKKDELEDILAVSEYDEKSVLRILLLFEEVFMTVFENNEENTVNAECAIIMYPDRFKLVGRDDGKQLDISMENMNIDSLRDYVLSCLISQDNTEFRYLMAMSFNRNMFEIRMNMK